MSRAGMVARIGPKVGITSSNPAISPIRPALGKPTAVMASHTTTPMTMPSTTCPRKKAFHTWLISSRRRRSSSV